MQKSVATYCFILFSFLIILLFCFAVPDRNAFKYLISVSLGLDFLFLHCCCCLLLCIAFSLFVVSFCQMQPPSMHWLKSSSPLFLFCLFKSLLHWLFFFCCCCCCRRKKSQMAGNLRVCFSSERIGGKK